MSKSKPAVLLQNLGSPNSTEVADVRDYLREFLMDGRVIDAPFPIRWMIVNLFILPIRPRKSAEAYREIWTDEGSPLIVISKRQQKLLAEALDIPVYLSMRYGNPSTPDVVAQMEKDGITDLFIIPLYPHYSMASYETAVVQLDEELAKLDHPPKVTLQKPYYHDPDYIDALAQATAPHLGEFDHLLVSYHGVPERHLQKSDPSHAHCLSCADCCDRPHPAHATCYRHQCLETTRLLTEKLGLSSNQFSVSFQSRLGREPWLEPYTDKTLALLPCDGKKRLRIMCPAFVSDCLETLEEINGEGQEIFKEAGGEDFKMIPCLNDHPEWIQWLKNKTTAWLDSDDSRPLHQMPKFLYERVK